MLGIVKPKDLDALLKKEKPRSEQSEEPKEHESNTGKKKWIREGNAACNGDTIPPLLKNIIAITAVQDNGRAAARAFGTSNRSASSFEKGILGDERGAPDESFKKQLDASLERIQAETSAKLLTTLGYITSGELESAELKTKLYAADKLAGVMGKVRERTGSAVQTNVVIYSPGVKEKVDYDVIDVG